jgi:hypothetical protein
MAKAAAHQGKIVLNTAFSKLFTTMSLYMDMNNSTALFKTYTYNLDSISNEEFLCCIDWQANATDVKQAQRVVFVAGSGDHIPIARTRLYVNLTEKQTHLSGMINSSERLTYGALERKNIVGTRVCRGNFTPAEMRGSQHSDISVAMAALGIEEVTREERKRALKNRQTSAKASSVGTIIDGNGDVLNKKPPVSSSPTKKLAHASTSSPTKARDLATRPTASAPSFPCLSYFNETRLKSIRSALRSTPVSVDPEEYPWKLVADDPLSIETKITDLIDPNSVDTGTIPVLSSVRDEYFLVFNDLNCMVYKLYEGKRAGPCPVCPLTGLRFCTWANA